ncbi:transporter [Sulfodiicoccus acidiphilus]|uniref:Transporter n=1 Tax=Sulfodiicoccus acidiphilus TaxID=1670455 RepID=A0A830GZB0_9CREN|nr:transporter [Sulfodiicoccus acidiphilus]
MVLAASVTLLITRRVRYDVVGLITMLSLILLGLVNPERALENFGSTSVLLLVALMIVSGFLSESGLLEVLGEFVTSRVRSEKVAVGLILVATAFISGFVSDVALTLSFLPLVVYISSKLGRARSKYLIPLSYSAILGGRYTMIGTSPNVVLDQFWIEKFHSGLPLFQFAPIGLAEMLAGLTVVVLVVVRLMPSLSSTSLEEVKVGEYLVEVGVDRESDLVGKSLSQLERELGVKVDHVVGVPRLFRSYVSSGDVLVLRVPPEKLPIITSLKGVRLSPSVEVPQGVPTFEVLVPNGSRLVGRTVGELKLADTYRVYVLGTSVRGTVYRLSSSSIQPGTVLLVAGKEEDVARLANDTSLVPLTKRAPKVFDRRSAMSALIALVAGVTMSLVGLNVAVAFLIPAAALMILTPKRRRVYEYVDWPVIFFVGSYLSLGDAVTSLAPQLAGFTGGSLLILFLMGLALANVVNNVAAAVILGPVALTFQDPLLATTVLAMACSSTFLLPFSHQANITVYNAAGYRVRDYLLGGAVLVVTVTVLTFTYVALVHGSLI